VTVLSRIVEPSVALVIPPAAGAAVPTPVAAPVVALDEALPDDDFRFGRASAGIASSERKRNDRSRTDELYINFMTGMNDQR